MNRLNQNLLIACTKGDVETVRQCIEQGADVNCMREDPVDLPITTAPISFPAITIVLNDDEKSLEIIRLLVNAGADINKRTIDLSTPETRKNGFPNNYYYSEDGFTPLMSCGCCGRVGIPNAANLLIDLGADIHAKDSESRTALMHIQDIEIITRLIELGADVNARDNQGRTPIMYQSEWECIRTLLDAGADINARDNKGQTPLFYHLDDEFVADRLFEFGAKL